jgi:autotransporter-associated beta strand protein
MKKPRFSFFAPSFRSPCAANLLGSISTLLFTIPAFAVNTTGVTNTYNGSLAASGLTSNANWTQGAPFNTSGLGSYSDLVFTGADSGSTFTTSGGVNTNMFAESCNVTDGNSYTLQINSSGSGTFNVGATPNDTGTAISNPILPFTNSVSGIAQDLIYLANGSSLTFNATNGGVEGVGIGTPATMNVRQAGNFNVGTDSILTINPAITGSAAITINGGGTTISNGTNTHSGSVTVNGGSLEIAGTHSGNGAITVNNGMLEISGTRSGTGTTTVRNGTLEISGTNAGTAYTVNGNVNPSEPVLKLSNVNALPLTATISGANSTTLDGIVDLAVAGAYTLGAYNAGHITFTTTSGSPTTLTFTDASILSTGTASNRTLTNASANLSIVFASTLDIGGVDQSATINSTGNTTVEAGILSNGDGIRNLVKSGSGTLTLNGSSAYAGTTTVSGGVLRLGHLTAIPGGIAATGGASNLVFNGTTGIIGLTAASGDFLRPLGTGPDQVTANPTADSALVRRIGFAAHGGDRIVDFGAPIQLSSTSHAGRGLNLATADSDSKVTLVNDISLVNSSRPVLVADGSAAVDAELSGVISHAGGTLVKSGGGTLALTGANTYGSESGGTEVLEGVLMVDGDSLSDDSKLVINGGKVQSTGTETVATLFFGDEQQIAGTWGSSASSAEPAFQDDTRFTGTGVVVVTTDPVTGSGYEQWALDNAGGQSADLDFDKDGVPNGVEFFMGETGSSFTPNPGIIAGTVTWPRDPDVVPAFKVQVSDTLTADDWQDIVPPHASIDETNPNQIVFTVPTEGPKNFCRLVVTP